jgi:hypothetical protein
MATTTNFGWVTPDDTSLVKDGAAAIRTLGQSIDTSMMDLEGGTTGQVLSKASNTDMDFTWVTTDDANAIQNSIVDAKGDLIGATANDTPARLAVGTNGQVLTADSTAATGLKWATASSGDLVRITKVTFTSASAVNVDNCFSSTYDFYLIQVKATNTVADMYCRYRMRASSTDNTASTYSSVNNYSPYSATAPASDGTANQTQGTIGYFQTTDEAYFNIDVRNPFASQYTTLFNSAPNTTYANIFSAIHKTKTSFDGISLYPSTGTFTGELNIYGYKKG